MPKVLIVDDSALMRKYLKSILEKAGLITDVARNGQECLEKITTFKPDAITLDINMPVMDGITCLSMIMNTAPKPVVMVSSLTEKGASATFEALELGALDYVPKPTIVGTTDTSQSANLLVEKVLSATKTIVGQGSNIENKIRVAREKAEVKLERSTQKPSKASEKNLVVIGVSTGGPGCLQEILQSFDESFPVPIVIAQHMPARFTKVFAERLNKICKLNVKEIDGTHALEAGSVYIAKGDTDATIIKHGRQLMVTSVPIDKTYLWHPSVSKLVSSAMQMVSAEKLVCVQLTGMGNDGADSMGLAHKKGAFTIAESQETAIVYGMPKELVAAGGATIELPNYKIADAIKDSLV